MTSPCDHTFPLSGGPSDRALVYVQCTLCGQPALALYAKGWMEHRSLMTPQEEKP